MHRILSIAIALLAAASFAVPAVSAENDKPSFEEADQDGDGKVSMDEAKQHGFDRYQFVAQDVDQDGMLTEEDWHYLSRRSNFVLYQVE